MKSANAPQLRLLAFFVVTFCLFGAMAYQFGFWGQHQRVEYSVKLTDAAGIVPNNAVKIAGVEVGKVQSVGVDGSLAKLVLRVDENVQIFQNGQVMVRAKSLLGEKYIQIDPGDASVPRLAIGGEIVQSRSTFEMDELLNALEPVVGSDEPLSARLVPILRRVESLLEKLDSPQFQHALEKDVDHARGIVTDVAVLTTSLRTIVEGREAEISRALSNMTQLASDPRWEKILGRVDRMTQAMEAALPEMIASTRGAVRAGQSVANRADAALSPETFAALQRTVQDMAATTQQARRLTERLSELDAALTKSPATGEDVGVLIHQLRILMDRAAALDERALRHFLQSEGLKVYVGRSKNARDRLEGLESSGD